MSLVGCLPAAQCEKEISLRAMLNCTINLESLKILIFNSHINRPLFGLIYKHFGHV